MTSLIQPLRNHSVQLIPLLIILIIGAGFRLWGLPFGLPNESRPDELANNLDVLRNLVLPLSQGDWSFNPHRFHYPSLYFYVGLLMSLAYWAWQFLLGNITTAQHLMASFWNDPTPFYMLYRWFSVLCGVLTIGVAYGMGKTIAGNPLGFLAATLMATNYLAIRNSHFGSIDTFWTLSICVALWTMLYWAKSLSAPSPVNEASTPQARSVPWSVSIAIGVAIGIKYPAAILLVPVWCLACAPLVTNKVIHWQAIAETVLKTTAIALLVFLMTSPWVLLDLNQFVRDIAYESSYYFTYRLKGIDPGWLFYPKFALWHGVGAGLLLCSILGAWKNWKSLPRTIHIVLLGFGLSYFLVCLGPNVRVMTRYALPLVPVILLYAALGIIWVANALGKRLQSTTLLPRKAIMAVLAGLLLLPSLSNSIAFDTLISKPDTRTLARDWIMSSLPPGQPVAAGPRYGSLHLPIRYPKLYSDPMRPPQPVRIEPWVNNERLVSTYQFPKLFDDLGIENVVLFGGMPMFSNTPSEWQQLEQHGKPLAYWSPLTSKLTGPSSAPHPPEFDPMDAMYIPFAHFEAFERPGPMIGIFHIQSSKSQEQLQQLSTQLFGRRF